MNKFTQTDKLFIEAQISVDKLCEQLKENNQGENLTLLNAAHKVIEDNIKGLREYDR